MIPKLLCFFILLGAFRGVAQQLPQDWRAPTRSEVSSEWRTKSDSRFTKVKADFDGDGKPDISELLIKPVEKKLAVFVWLSSDQKWRQLGESFSMEALERFGIDYVKPGKYETACGKGYGDYACAHGEPDWLKLSRPAIDFFYTESSDSIFYWDGKLHKFTEVLMSD